MADLRGAKIKAQVTGRPKHYYSVYQKMIVRGRDFAERAVQAWHSKPVWQRLAVRFTG